MNSSPNLVFLAILGIAFVANVALMMQPEPSLLYIQEAESGALAASGDGEEATFTLTLNAISILSTYQSDQLDRITGRIRTRNFVRIEGLFERDDPPKAVVILRGESADPAMNAIAVELHNPRHDPELQQLTYDVVILDHVPSAGLKAWRFQIDNRLPEQFGPVQVIIDRASFQLDFIVWTFAIEDETGAPMEDLALTLDYTRLNGEPFTKTQRTNSLGEVSFSLPSTFNLAAMLTYSTELETAGPLRIYSIPITARCSGTFELVFGDEPAEGEPLTLACPVGD